MFHREMRYLRPAAAGATDYGFGLRTLTGLCSMILIPGLPEKWRESGIAAAWPARNWIYLGETSGFGLML